MQFSNEFFDQVLQNDELIRNLIVQHNVTYNQFVADQNPDIQNSLKKIQERIRDIDREQKEYLSILRKAVSAAKLPSNYKLDLRNLEFRSCLINNNNDLTNDSTKSVSSDETSKSHKAENKREGKSESTDVDIPVKIESDIEKVKLEIKDEIKLEDDMKIENFDSPCPTNSEERPSSVETVSTDSNNVSEEERSERRDFLKVTDEKRHFMEMCNLITHTKHASLQRSLSKRNPKSTKRDDYVYEKHQKKSRTNGSDQRDGDNCKRPRINNNVHLENGCSVPPGITVERVETTCNVCRHPGILSVCEVCLSKYHVSCHTTTSPPARRCPKCLGTKMETLSIKTEYATAAHSSGLARKARENAEVYQATRGLHKIDAGQERAVLAGALDQLPASTQLIPIGADVDRSKLWKHTKSKVRVCQPDGTAKWNLLVPGGAAVTVRYNQSATQSTRRVEYVDLGDDDDDNVADGKAYGVRGKSNDVRGKTDGTRGKTNDVGSKADGATGKTDGATGKIDSVSRKADSASGKADGTRGKAEDVCGQTDAAGRKTDGTSDPGTRASAAADGRPAPRRKSPDQRHSDEPDIAFVNLDEESDGGKPVEQCEATSSDARKCDDSLLYAMLAGNKPTNNYVHGSRAQEGPSAGPRAAHPEPAEHVKLEEAHLPAPPRTTLTSPTRMDTSSSGSETRSMTSSTDEAEDLELEDVEDDNVAEVVKPELMNKIEEDREESASAFELSDLEYLTSVQRRRKQLIRVEDFDAFERAYNIEDEELRCSKSHDEHMKQMSDS